MLDAVSDQAARAIDAHQPCTSIEDARVRRRPRRQLRSALLSSLSHGHAHAAGVDYRLGTRMVTFGDDAVGR